jgi:DnaJ-class molecular chaperone
MISRVYHILMDTDQRSVYDETGDVGDDGSFPDRPPNQVSRPP